VPKRVNDQPVDFTDILPTMMELCGIERSQELPLDGKSLVQILAGKADRLPDRDWAHTQYAQTRVLRDRRYKLYSDGRLFDLIADPDEQRDLTGQESLEALAARQRLAAVLATFPPDATLPFKPRSLSYFKEHPEDRPAGKASDGN
jgi:arylsulfatase A